MSSDVVAVIVAAGSGVRLGGDTPKALRELHGRSLIGWAVSNLAAGGVGHAVIVRPPKLDSAFRTALTDSPIPLSYVSGGKTRQESVAQGLGAILGDSDLADSPWVLVHDAARALTPPSVIQRVIAELRAGAVGVIPVIGVYDSLREIISDYSQVTDRSRFRAVQTPQGFAKDVLFTAHRNLRDEGLSVTDDAAAVEALGYPITLVDGAREAFKITDPFDLLIAEVITKALPK